MSFNEKTSQSKISINFSALWEYFSRTNFVNLTWRLVLESRNFFGNMTNSEELRTGKLPVSNLDATINLTSIVQSMGVDCLTQELRNNNDNDDGSSDIGEGNDKTLIHGDFFDNHDGIDYKDHSINEIRKVNEIAPEKHKVTNELLLEPFRYISSIPGKNIREKLINCFQLWLNVEEKNILDEIKVSFVLTFFLLKINVVNVTVL